jgi:aldose 1-epimerase
MSPRILLADGHAEAVVLPVLGGAIASYDLLAGGTRQALFRPATPGATDPFAMACIPLVPWSNRISGGGFRHAGRFYSLKPNWPGCRIHCTATGSRHSGVCKTCGGSGWI